MSSENAPVVVTPIDGGFKLAFRGPMQTQPEWLQGEMEKVLKARPTVVQFDLAGIEYIASAGLGILVGFRNRIIEGGGAVKTVAVHPRVLEVLKLAALMKILNVETGGA